RLVHGDPDAGDARERRQNGVRDTAGGGLDQTMAAAGKSMGRGFDDCAVGDGVRKLVRARGVGEVEREFEVDDETLADFFLMLHHTVMGMNQESRYEDAVGHCVPRMASATRSACTVSATSWTRTMAAPFSTARRWLAMEPPTRRLGGEGTTASMKRLREAPTSRGSPNDFSRASRAITVM